MNNVLHNMNKHLRSIHNRLVGSCAPLRFHAFFTRSWCYSSVSNSWTIPQHFLSKLGQNPASSSRSSSPGQLRPCTSFLYVGHIEGLFHENRWLDSTSNLNFGVFALQLPQIAGQSTCWILKASSRSGSAISAMMTVRNTGLISETLLYPSASHPNTV